LNQNCLCLLRPGQMKVFLDRVDRVVLPLGAALRTGRADGLLRGECPGECRVGGIESHYQYEKQPQSFCARLFPEHSPCARARECLIYRNEGVPRSMYKNIIPNHASGGGANGILSRKPPYLSFKAALVPGRCSTCGLSCGSSRTRLRCSQWMKCLVRDVRGYGPPSLFASKVRPKVFPSPPSPTGVVSSHARAALHLLEGMIRHPAAFRWRSIPVVSAKNLPSNTGMVILD